MEFYENFDIWTFENKKIFCNLEIFGKLWNLVRHNFIGQHILALVGQRPIPNIPHGRCTHSEVELRKCCLGQSEKRKIPYHLIKNNSPFIHTFTLCYSDGCTRYTNEITEQEK